MQWPSSACPRCRAPIESGTRFCGACGQALFSAVPTEAAPAAAPAAPPPSFAATIAHGGIATASPPPNAAPKRRFAGTVLGMSKPGPDATNAEDHAHGSTFTRPARERAATAGYYERDKAASAGRNLPAAASRHYGMGTLGVPPSLAGAPAAISRAPAVPPSTPVARPWWRRPKSGLIVLGAFLAGVVLTVSVMAVAVGAYLGHDAPAGLEIPPSAAHIGR